jgi:hypothetical protein
MKRMAYLASKQVQRLANLIHLTILTVIFFLFCAVWSLNAVYTPFYTPNASHVIFNFETSPAARETQPFDEFDSNFFPVGDISTFKRWISSILNAECNEWRI